MVWEGKGTGVCLHLQTSCSGTGGVPRKRMLYRPEEKRVACGRKRHPYREQSLNHICNVFYSVVSIFAILGILIQGI